MRRIVLLCALGVTLAACDSNPVSAPTATPTQRQTDPTPSATASTPASSQSPADAPVPEIWQFEARDLSGGTIDGRIFAGSKVAVWLWAPWCGPCGRLAPEVAAAARDYPQITFLGVPGQDSDDAHRAFVEEHGLDAANILHAIDERRGLWGHFGSNTQEAWLFVDDDGSVGARTRYGEMDPTRLRGYLDELVAA